MMSNGYIYKITNTINGKSYIGKTVHTDPYERWNEHKNDRNKPVVSNRILYKAMNKYGIQNFNFDVLEEVAEKSIEDREIYYIDLYGTFCKYGNGYNMTLGGDGKQYIDKEEVINTFLTNFNCLDTALELEIHEVTVKTTVEECGLYEYRLYRSAKPIELEDKNSGETFVFKSTRDALHYYLTKNANKYGEDAAENRQLGNMSARFGKAAEGLRHTAYGYYCRYITIKEYRDYVSKEIQNKAYNSEATNLIYNSGKITQGAKRVVKYDKYFNAKKLYESIRQAVDDINGTTNMQFEFNQICRQGKLVHGYRWQLLEALKTNINGKAVQFNTIFDRQLYESNTNIKLIESNKMLKCEGIRYQDYVKDYEEEKCAIKPSESNKLTTDEKIARLNQIRQLASEGLSLTEIGKRLSI